MDNPRHSRRLFLRQAAGIAAAGAGTLIGTRGLGWTHDSGPFGQAPAIVTSQSARPSSAFGVASGDVDGDRAETDPKVFTNVRMHYIVTGRNLDPKKVERAVQLSEEKYCSASAMFGKTATLTHTIEIRAA